ncbi:MAG: ZPR1 zinc-finger domain protein [Promethearchaeota archaeon]|nr:MAG: ZPR1 zinc-finger domain protein [Candidatus Lokiarchaeota archaeon]
MSDETRYSNESYEFRCPKCKEGLIQISQTEYDLPDEDKMLIIKLECSKCDFLKTDIIPMTARTEPGRSILKVKEEADLRSKIYRSPSAKLEVPELELMVNPGPYADFYFTNVEGILLRFEKAVTTYKNSLNETDPKKKEVITLLNDMKKAMNGQMPFTLIIEDTGGGSYIIPENKQNYKFLKLDPNMMNEKN